MKRTVLILMLLALATTSLWGYAETAEPVTPREWMGLEAEASPEWAVAQAEKAGAKQILIVAAYEKTTAWVSMLFRSERWIPPNILSYSMATAGNSHRTPAMR